MADSMRGTSAFMRWATSAILIILFAAGAIFLFSYFSGKNSGVVAMEFTRPDHVSVGEPFSLTLSLSNTSGEVLKNARLLLTLPDGVAFLGQPQDQRVRDRALGDLTSGNVANEPIDLIVLSGAYSAKRIEAKLSYVLPGTSAAFEQTSQVDVSVRDAAIRLSLAGPESVLSGERFPLQVTYQNASVNELKNLRLILQYPSQFRFESASRPPSAQKNEWHIPSFSANASDTIALYGNIVASEGTAFGFTASIEAEFANQKYAIAAQTVNVTIATSPLSLSVTVNGDNSSYTARPGDVLDYALAYKNNSSVSFQNVSLKVTLTGDMFDFVSARSSGIWNPANQTYMWTSGNLPAFSILAPGAEGTIPFSVSLRTAFPAQRASDKNYTLRLKAQIESPTVPPGSQSRITQSVDSLDVKVAGSLRVDAQAFHSSVAGLTNTGPYPARAGQKTQYIAKWLLSAAGTDMGNVEVGAILPQGVAFTGQTKQSMGAAPTYDPQSRKVVWKLPSLPANKGYLSAPAEAEFQIELTPSASYIGQYAPLLGETSVTGEDTFTKLTVLATDTVLDTSIPDDFGVGEVDRRVQP